jgi:hypothetical protein
VTAAVGLGRWLAGWSLNGRLAELLALVGASGLGAGIMSWRAASSLASGRPFPARCAAMLLSLTLATAGFAVVIFVGDQFFTTGRQHAAFPSRAFATELLQSSVSLAYLFAVIGLRMYLPFGLLPLFAASFWFAVWTAREGHRVAAFQPQESP